MAWSNERRISECLANIREIPPAEAREIYLRQNFEKHGIVAACRTTPEGFMDYLERRAAADQHAKHGR